MMGATAARDPIVTAWYDLFLDLWNLRNRLENVKGEVLEGLWKEYGGDSVPLEDRSVIVTSLLLVVRHEFVELDRAARSDGQLSDEGIQRFREQAREIHDRWAERFRAAFATRPAVDH